MYAIIEDSGSQRKVMQGDEILVDLIEGGESRPGAPVRFDKVLLVGARDGKGDARIGAPYLAGAHVTGEIIEPVVLGDKIHIFKHRRRKGYKRKTGHRQRYTSVRITAIAG